MRLDASELTAFVFFPIKARYLLKRVALLPSIYGNFCHLCRHQYIKNFFFSWQTQRITKALFLLFIARIFYAKRFFPISSKVSWYQKMLNSGKKLNEKIYCT